MKSVKEQIISNLAILALFTGTIASVMVVLTLLGIIRFPESTPPAISAPPVVITPTTAPSGFGSNVDDALAEIRRRGKIVVAVSTESGPHTYHDNDDAQFKGFEVELVEEIVGRWFQVENPVASNHLEFVGVNVVERENTLRNNPSIDFLAGAVSYTDKRCLGDLICTLEGHFQDKSAIVVHRNTALDSYCDPDLDNSRTSFIVLSRTTAQTSLDAYKQECGFVNDIQSSSAPSRQDAFAAMNINDLAIYKTDRRILDFYVKNLGQSDSLQVIPDDGSKAETYVFWLTADKKGLRNLLDDTIRAMKQDNTYAEICSNYFSNESYCNS